MRQLCRDPLDSNDYTGGGDGSDTDNDIHDLYEVPIERDGRDYIRSLFFQRGKLLMPLFHGSVLHFQIIDSKVLSSAAVEYEK